MNENMQKFRAESDSAGSKNVSIEAYYGVQLLRAAAIANNEARLMNKEVREAIVQACDEIISGKFHNEFIIDSIQGLRK